MKDLEKLLGRTFSEEAIAEIMIARSALEQKNETLDRKDALIGDLLRRNRELERRLEEERRASPEGASAGETGLEAPPGGREGVEDLIGEIVRLLVRHERVPSEGVGEEVSASGGFEAEIVQLLRDRWGLAVIEEEPVAIDPLIHRVVEVVKGPGGGGRAVSLSKGYRLGKKILAPMKIRVFEGGESCLGRGT